MNKPLCHTLSRRLAIVLMTSMMAWASAGVAQAQEEKTVLVSLSKASEPFMARLRMEAEDEAKRLNLRLVFEDGKGDSAIQSAGLEAALAGGKIDAVLIAPNDVHALASAVNQVMSKGLPVVTMDRRISGTRQPVPHVGVDNVQGGRILASWVVQRFPRGASVLHLTGQPGSSTAIDRARGVREAFAAAGPQYRVVADVSANWSRAEALMVTEGQLTYLKPLPDAIVAGNDDMAMGALEAIHLARLDPRSLPVIGYDALPFALQKMREGELAATVDQHVDRMSRIALGRIADFLRTGKPIESLNLVPTLVGPDALKQRDAAGKSRP